jgi:hemoglobin/transferrin/lactoferrin receptor protein
VLGIIFGQASFDLKISEKGIGMTKTYIKFAGALVLTLSALVITFLAAAAVLAQQSQGNIAGAVKDQNGAAVVGAAVSLLHSQQAVLRNTVTDGSGNFSFDNIPPGSYEIRINQPGFDTRRVSAQVASNKTTRIEVILQVAPIDSEVTISAETGQAQDKDRVPQAVNVISENAIQQRTTAVLAQFADEEVGLGLQRTSPSMGEVFVRGLTGKNVPVYVDGVRYTTSTQRGGVSTFLNLNEPTSLRAVEVLRGPNSAQYGSDSLGGVVQLVSRAPVFGGDKSELHGESNTFFTSSDASFGSNLLLSYGTKHFGFYGNAAARRINTLRTANGLDSHSAVTRFLGLPSTVLYGPRMPDTAFTQYGGTAHINYAPTTDRQFIFHYQRSQQDGGKRFDQLLGGDGNLIADLRNLMLDFGYGRYIKQGAGFFDTASFTFSVNSQREERRNQGGQGNPVGDITHQYERTNALGFSFYLDKQTSSTNSFLIGGDIYRERVRAPAHTLILSPPPVRDVPSRPRVPDGATYLTYGVYIQDAWDVVPETFRLSGALRYSIAQYRSRAANSPVAPPLWPNDSLRAADFSGRLGATYSPVRGVSLVFNYSRGFRAPNITDLGTLGLTGDGFEADFASSSALGGTIGTTANDQAVTTGIPVQKQRSEISQNVDAGFRLRRWGIETELTYFWISIDDAIVKQTLILPLGSVGRFLGSEQIIFQHPNGWVRVAASAAPVLIRANFTDARIQGLEYYLKARLNRDWAFNGNFTYIEAKDRQTGLPPNIEGGTPPPTGFLSLRYAPSGKSFWIEGYSTLAARQNRLSTLDLADRRTGATRSRANIQNYFRRGACVQGLTTPGPTGCGSAGGILIATGENLAQVQNRVLGAADSAPLFTALPGYGLFNVRGGFRLGERSEITLDFENITDQFYRNVSWGIDGPGRSVTARYHYRF